MCTAWSSIGLDVLKAIILHVTNLRGRWPPYGSNCNFAGNPNAATWDNPLTETTSFSVQKKRLTLWWATSSPINSVLSNNNVTLENISSTHQETGHSRHLNWYLSAHLEDFSLSQLNDTKKGPLVSKLGRNAIPTIPRWYENLICEVSSQQMD